METSLRDKVKDFGAVHRSYESISKHNQVRGWHWGGGSHTVPPGRVTTSPAPRTCMHTQAHVCTHTLGRNAASSGVEAVPVLGCSIPQ